jgi:hypothetical protein
MFHPSYGVHPAVHHGKAVVANLPGKTGASIGEWVARVRRAGHEDRRAIVAWLRSGHGLGGTTANLVATVALEGIASIDDEAYLAAAPGYVDALYSGSRAALRPLHDAVVRLCLDLGPDVRLCPATTVVPVYRRHVIAQIRPATRARIDLGLALGPGAAGGRLIDTGGAAKGDRITHRIALTGLADLDGEVAASLREAYIRDQEA